MNDAPTTNTSHTELSQEEQKMMLLGEDRKKTAKLEACLRRIFNHAPTATFLTHLVRYYGTGSDQDRYGYGYVYVLQTCQHCKEGHDSGACETCRERVESGKSDCCFDKLNITRGKLRTCRKNTRGWLVDKRPGWGNMVYYRVRLLDLMDFIETMAPEFFGIVKKQTSQNNQTEWLDQPDRVAEPTSPITVSTSSYRSSSGDHGQRAEEHEVHEESSHDKAEPDARSAREPVTLVGKDRTFTVDELLDILVKRLAKYGITPLTKHERARYAEQIASLIRDDGADEQDIARVFWRMTFRTLADENAYRLPLMKAYEDEVAAKPMPKVPERVREIDAKERREKHERMLTADRAARAAEESPY